MICAVLTTFWSPSLHFYHGAVGEPHRDALDQDAFDGRAIEGQQELLTDVICPDHSMQGPQGLLDDS